MKRLNHPGIFDEILTIGLEQDIAEKLLIEDWKVTTDQIDGTALPEYLAQHVHLLLLRALKEISISGQTAEQISLANQIVDLLYKHGIESDEKASRTAKRLLDAVKASGINRNSTLPRPSAPLRQTSLHVNSRADVCLSSEIKKEILSADRIDLLCAFVRFSGLRLFIDELQEQINKGTQVRVITSVYTGSTERRALDALSKIGAAVKISYDIGSTRLHAKAWLFHRSSGLHTAYIGSSNLTHTAQVDGLEWNVRVSSTVNPKIIETFQKTFDQYWQEPEFESYDPQNDAEKLDKALAGNSSPECQSQFHEFLSFIDVAPKSHQMIALDALKAERALGFHHNLVVAATGTGKTWIAAFDFKRLQADGKGNSLLFIAHREEILRQSQQVFQLVLRNSDFGELLVGGAQPQSGKFVFASIQSITKRVNQIRPDEFDVVIVDEFHHAAADSYDRVLEHLSPKILLGLTATPERADGKSVIKWFDNRTAYESRLWDALGQDLLCPFHYFGVNDQTDLSTVRFEKGRYVLSELEGVFTGDDSRALLIRNAVEKYVTDPHSMCALGFCAGVEHAHFMARKFTLFGYPSEALDATTPARDRREIRLKLQLGEIRAIFTVDLFNEGVDLPEVDTVLMLRPTESATVFLQQLGRGLRRSEGKSVLTVLDFVGQVHQQYRYDIRYLAILGGTRKQVQDAIEKDFPYFPPGCAIKFDRIAKQTVLQNIKAAVKTARTHLIQDLSNLGPSTRLPEFIQESGVSIEDIYARPRSRNCFTELRCRAGFIQDDELPENFDQQFKALGRLIHVNDLERIENWRAIFESDSSTPVSELRGREYRFGLMLLSILDTSKPHLSEADKIVKGFRDSPQLRSEIRDLLDFLRNNSQSSPQPLSPNDVIPFASHATYSAGEISAAINLTSRKGNLFIPQTGVLWDEASQTDLLFITLEKNDKDYSPSTRYADYPISPSKFHWESQNSASPTTKTGKRHINQSTSLTKVILFVRMRKTDARGETAPYYCLGYANYKSHESEKPMKIIWKLERPMPGWLYHESKSVAS